MEERKDERRKASREVRRKESKEVLKGEKGK